MLSSSKHTPRRFVAIPLAVAVLCVAWPVPAYAYIDPAVGSMVLQAILAAVIGVGIFFRDARLKIMSLFGRVKPSPPGSD